MADMIPVLEVTIVGTPSHRPLFSEGGSEDFENFERSEVLEILEN